MLSYVSDMPTETWSNINILQVYLTLNMKINAEKTKIMQIGKMWEVMGSGFDRS